MNKILTAVALAAAVAFLVNSADAKPPKPPGWMNGVSLNGMSANGAWQNGLTMNGWTTNGLSRNGFTQNGIWSNGST